MAYQVITTVTKPSIDTLWWGMQHPIDYAALTEWELINLAGLQLSKTQDSTDPNTLLETRIYASKEACQTVAALRSEHPLAKARNAYNASHGITNTTVSTEI